MTGNVRHIGQNIGQDLRGGIRKGDFAFLLVVFKIFGVIKVKERRRITRGCIHQHARHVVVAPGVLFLLFGARPNGFMTAWWKKPDSQKAQEISSKIIDKQYPV